MHTRSSDAALLFSNIGAQEHARLVGLCAYFTGDRHAAEDLAQETLLVAWRLRDRLNDPERIEAWLAAIARNVCRRWRRTQRREQAYGLHGFVPQSSGDDALAEVADPFDVEVELERAELTTLLDRAMALLPPETRTILVQKYVAESPHAAIAAQLGLTENAVAVRLHRGKLAFRKILHSELHDAVAVFECGAPGVPLRQTTIWCPICGVQRLHGRFDREQGILELRCLVCCAGPLSPIWCMNLSQPMNGAKQFRTALNQGMTECFHAYSTALVHRTLVCTECGRVNELQFGLPDGMQPPCPTKHGLYITCPTCGSGGSSSLRMFVQSSPEVRAFWSRHPQMRTLPEQEIDVAGTPAILIRFQSVRDPAYLDAIIARDTYRIVELHASDS